VACAQNETITGFGAFAPRAHIRTEAATSGELTYSVALTLGRRRHTEGVRRTEMKPRDVRVLVSGLALVGILTGGAAVLGEVLGTAFTYQGRLTDANSPASGDYDFEFTLYDANTGGSVAGGPLSEPTVSVKNGVFSVDLDFGSAVFTGEDRWLEIAVRASGDANAPTVLSPHQRVTPAPYALALPGLWIEPGPDANIPSLIGGYRGNIGDPNFVGQTIGGGWLNVASGEYATVGGGRWNDATEDDATVGGGYSNIAAGNRATIGGGERNEASGSHATVAGGFHNTASGTRDTVGGGYYNEATGFSSTIGGGYSNAATYWYATVGGGSSNDAVGMYATIPGGYWNEAQGDYSFAVGRRARITDPNHDGAFLFADSSNVHFYSVAANEFAARCTGGARFVSAIDGSGNPTAGVQLASGGGSWSTISDRNAKDNYEAVDGRAVLDKLANVPVATWNYKSQDATIRHIGPVAQDFHAAFAVGEDDRHITTVDADGVALAAIKGLHELVKEKDAEIAAQKGEIAALKERNANLEARFAAMEAIVAELGKTRKGGAR